MHKGLRITALALAVAAGGVSAQPAVVATLSSLEGTVLVSEADGIASAKAQQRLAMGTRVLTTAGSKATIKFDQGCVITLEENQRFVVREFRECRELLAGIEQVVPTAGATRTAGFVPLLIPATAVGVGAALVNRGKTSVTPN